MTNLRKRIRQEFLEFLFPAIFFLVALHFLAVIRAMMLEEYALAAATFLTATIAALVMAKVVLLADLLPFVDRFPGRPLIYNIAWKTGIYFVAALGAHYLEHLVHYLRKQGSLAAANRQLLENIVWPHFWAVQILALVLLLMYCTLWEVARAMGRDRVLQMFFGPSGKPPPGSAIGSEDKARTANAERAGPP